MRGGEGEKPSRPDSPFSDDTRRIRIIIAAMTEAGLLALAAALLIAASPTTNIELVTQPPVTGR